MKFQAVAAFEQHLHALSEKTIPPVCVVIASDLLERQYLSSLVVGAFKKMHPIAEVISMDLSKLSFDVIRDELMTSDLFSAKKMVHFKRMEEASKSLFESLATLMIGEGSFPFLLFEGEHFKNDPKFFEKLGLEYMLMDLTKEKPWDRKNRIIQWVQGFAAKNKKSFQRGVLEQLYEKSHKSLSQLMQEAEKLICYVHSSSVITEEHVKLLCGLEEEKSSWSFAEAIVWEEKGSAIGASYEIDAQSFYSMLGQLRYHYQIQNKLKSLLLSGVSEEEMGTHFPTLQPKTLSKYCRAIQDVQEDHIKQALNTLFECEIQAKTQSIDVSLLWTSLIAKLSKR